ncbi:glycosyltransferase family 4 protein [Thermoleophilum album]|uniref:Glycosyltransferase involved in cell wall bisynthesis n=1 Tax=Thermoleophilum album TaxID=29539 RepID=A0A1H6FLI0_THEAL|nr:glycosyltransferase family 1 protein [Thermoleophilum album]SEH11706.1 Glycosyltransferase involved in cell wall bisynthesis [Thermoleophilum album]
MRIAINAAFLSQGGMGGLETYTRELVAALSRRRDIELVLLLSSTLADDRLARMAEVALLPLDPRRRLDWVRADQLEVPRLAHRLGVELVHSLASTGPTWGRVRRVVTVHDLAFARFPRTHFGPRALGMALLVPAAARTAARVIVPSRATRDEVVRLLRVPSERVDVVPEGLGQVPVTATSSPAEALSKSAPGERSSASTHDLPSALSARLAAAPRPVALSVSAKRPHKNLERLIRAIALIPRERRPLLVLPGYPTPYERELEQLAERTGIGDHVVFLGWLPPEQLEAVYRIAWLFVFPSLYEGFGLPVLEAMARGVPVATSDRASLPEVAGPAALYFDPLSEASIAASIERLLFDRELAAALRRAGLERARRFSWDACAEATVASYRAALAETPAT